MKERGGIIRDTATTVDETARSAVETAQTVNMISKEVRKAAPETAAEISKVSETAKERTWVAAEKTREAVKAKASLKKGQKEAA